MFVYFVLSIFVISIIRLGLLFMGDAEDKVAKFTQWFIGMIMIIIAWFVFGKVWHVNTSLKLNDQQKIEIEKEDKTKNENSLDINLSPEQ